MELNLFSANTPANFWCLHADIHEEQWENAIEAATPILNISNLKNNSDSFLETILGEGQFGKDHWKLSPSKRLYYFLKPVLPKRIILWMRQQHSISAQSNFALNWPIEDRYVRFQWEVIRQLLINSGQSQIPFIHFWPDGYRFAFVLTHDIESAEGQDWVRRIVELEKNLGFRSSFCFTPDKYNLDHDLIAELHEQGFEVGVHGLKHDGKLFNSKEEFLRRTKRINDYLQKLNAVSFRAPFCIRNPDWMQALDIEYDLSFFDTDPFEPISGGTMSIWPFIMGHFIELPYTLVQDHTLVNILGERTPNIWLEKIDFIEKFHGMALLNTHPDYLSNPSNWDVYSDFLNKMKDRKAYWHALPREIANWWRARFNANNASTLPRAVQGEVRLEKDDHELIVTYL